MKVQFLKDRDVEAQGVVVQSYKAGEVYEMTAASAKRWIRRQLATEVQGKPKPTKTGPADKPKPAKASPKKRAMHKRTPPITSTKEPSE